MDANELGRWTRFAAKGGIGKCFAVQDCVAEEAEDLMFLKDDEIVVLMQLPGQEDTYLGYCEGVVGRFRGSDVRFQGRLKKPVMAKRSSRSLSRSSSRPSSSQSSGTPHSRENHARESPYPPAPSMSQSRSMTLTLQGTPTTSPSVSATASPLLGAGTLLPPHSPYIPAGGDGGLHVRTASHASHSSSSTALDSAPRTPADLAHQDQEGAGLVRIVSLSRQVDSPSELGEDDTMHAEIAKSSLTTATAGHSHAHASELEHADTLRYGADDTFDDEPSTRISIALSDGDGETGIGLSLLQDFVNSGIDDADSVHSGSSTPEPTEQPTSPALTDKKPTPSIRSFATSEKLSIYSNTSAKRSSDALSPEGPVSPSSAPPSPREVLSRNSGHPSFTSNTDSDYCAEEWEGASDIYDNYRYSRYSMASRASRLSKGSMYTVASAFGLEAPPPVPFDGRRPSIDSVRQNFGLGRERLGSTATASSSVEDVRRTVPAEPPRQASSSPKEPGTPEGKRIPPPLELRTSHHAKQSLSPTSEPGASPLLNAFNSPMSSPTPGSAQFSPLSPMGNSFSNIHGGAASALRQRLELERGSRPASPRDNGALLAEPHDTGKARLSTQPIVVDDEDGPPDLVVPTSPGSRRSESPSTQPGSPSILSEKKRMIETTYIVANQAPPPPYTPLSPTSETMEGPLLASPHSPPPQQTSQPQLQPGSRSRNLDIPQNEFVRQSIFMPHPHAPKPVASPNGPSGPMYGRMPVSTQSPAMIPGSVSEAVSRALREYSNPQRRGRVTIYAKFDHDLASSVGPVPVSFTLDPPNNIPAHKHRAQTLPTPVEPFADPAKEQPKANFFPAELKKPRPRSRSFSGFDSSQLEVIVPDGESTADGNSISQSASLNALTRRSRSSSNASSTSSPILASTSTGATGARPAHKPSPLSLSQNNIVASPASPPLPSPRSPRSPASSAAPRSPVALSSPTSPVTSHLSLGQASTVLSPPTSSSPLPATDVGSSMVARSVSGSSDHHSVASTSPLRYRPKHMLRHSRSSNFSNTNTNRTSTVRELSPSRSSMQGRQSVESEGSHRSEVRSVASPVPSLSPPMPQTLRSKLSLPALKIKSSDRSIHSIQSEERSPTLSIAPSIAPSVTPSMSPSENQTDKPRVQIKDVDFELVKPAGQLSVIEEDRSSSPLPSPVRPDTSLRAASPAFSMFSGISARTAPTPGSRSDTPASGAPDSKESKESKEDVEAHRQRELRWISTISSVPAGQARKNKKVRKLLWEGVPASVRYIVWAHLTDSKAKRIENIYYKLTQRERVPAASNIERDLRRVFPEEHQLHDGSLLNVLQAYLTMVPDLHYSRGLTVIAGHLLLQSPEEDAFWTFVSLMDTHLRSYFSGPAQMEIDSTLFGKAVESNDSGMAKKVFVEMDIPPASLCRPWFTALFLEALPLEHSQRVWDIFLFEGVPFLFRVGLAIMMRCKQQVMQCAERDVILNLLLHPPPTVLPTTADAFLELTSAVKLKDEDVRKQRAKLAEAHVKRQNQARTLASQATSAGLPGLPAISLPRK